MTLLIDIRSPEWLIEEDLRDQLAPQLPGVRILCRDPGEFADEVTVLAAVKLYPGVAASLPALKLVQKLGAGVDGIVRDPDLLPDVRVCRLRPNAPAIEIAEYCVAHVLNIQQHIGSYRSHAEQKCWHPQPPLKTSETTVAVLGLGHIGATVADYFNRLGYTVLGWSRTEKNLPGVECFNGPDQLDSVLAKADYVASVLPSTPKTHHLFNASTLGKMKPGAVLINAGRGDLINEDDLLECLDQGYLGGAVLDVFSSEPLQPEHRFWNHPLVTVTPHVSGWHLDGGLDDIAENYRRLSNSEPLLNEIDRTQGY